MFQKLFAIPFVVPAIMLGLGFFFSAGLISYTFYAVRSLDNTLAVTGSAKEAIRADRAKWALEIYQTTFEGDLASAYARVARDLEAVKKHLATAGIPADSITVKTVTADQDWSYSSQGGPIRYRVHQEVIVESEDVDGIDALAQRTSQLISAGVQVTPRQPEFYVSTLPEIRIRLLGQAIADAKARAESIVETTGAKVGKLKSASSGVVQVLAPNATNVEDYGSYDTSTIEKEVMVTARATFLVR